MPIHNVHWKPDVQNIPFDTPVLVARYGYTMPFTVTRDKDNPDVVAIHLGHDDSPYGFYVDLENISGYVDIGPLPAWPKPKG